MNFSRLAIVFLAAGAVFVSCNDKKSPAETVTEATKEVAKQEVAGVVEKTTFQIEGMTCAIGCAKLIEGKLAGLDGVKVATVDFETKTATVEFDDNKQNVESLIKTVEKIANGIYTVDTSSIASVK
ncbi:heavy-metal-associated domain-containing protein [Myroides pelagicus]|uniref:Heavy metal transporter n=1 Tax=Myroides pelagicus TaxID=270914 RepID=A0A7K1GK68_9FLAO|nr:heavy-metal-associated domain-containing protein [Myroides pelagicus]MEC4112804.1 heavy-metal-associated domain-containing protein [Myroides pelagicus]MTH28614.1 heavy metal transporter [Myroides pelagicus]